MSKTLTVGLIQTHLVWENPEANKQQLTPKIYDLAQNTELIILPEMFTSGFTMNAKMVAESLDGNTVMWMSNFAKKNKYGHNRQFSNKGK